MTEQTSSRTPVPDYADLATVIDHVVGPSRFSEALELHEWIKVLLQGGFTLGAEPETTASGQRLLRFDEPGAAIRAVVEYGSYWPSRTAISAPSSAAGSWWVACAGLIPPHNIIAASLVVEPGASTVGELLEAKGWSHTIRNLAKDGVTVAMDGWTNPEGTRTALRRDEVHDQGWLLTYSDLRRVSIISASLDTPPGIIAALAATN